MLNSKQIINEIKEKFGNKFEITTTGSRNKFPLGNAAYYNPDLVFWSKKNDSVIKAIIEIEQVSRKNMVGGVITADYCMGIKKQKPFMFVLALKNERDRKDYQKREKLFKKYTKHLKKIIIGNRDEVIKALSNLKNL